MPTTLNTLRLRQNNDHFANSIFRVIMAMPLGDKGIISLGCPSIHPTAHDRLIDFPFVCPSVHPSIPPEMFPVIFLRTHGRNGLKFGMPMYPDHLQKWLIRFRSQPVNLPILVPLSLSETGHIWGFRAFSWERMGGIAWNFTWWCILTTFRNYKILVMVCWFSSFLAPIWLSETGQIWVFWHFLDKRE